MMHLMTRNESLNMELEMNGTIIFVKTHTTSSRKLSEYPVCFYSRIDYNTGGYVTEGFLITGRKVRLGVNQSCQRFLSKKY